MAGGAGMVEGRAAVAVALVRVGIWVGEERRYEGELVIHTGFREARRGRFEFTR